MRRYTLLRLLGLLLACFPTNSLADRNADDLMSLYGRIADSYPVSIKGNRAEFNDGTATWTILGATQESGKAQPHPLQWSVGDQPYQILNVIQPISNTYILPYSDPVPNTTSLPPLTLMAARREIEAASFVIRSGDHALQDIRIAIDNFKLDGRNERISKDNIDIRLVKVWYQASDSIHRQHGGGKILVPELLLHDPDLVRVNHQEQINLVKNVDFLNDTDQLLPFNIPARTNQQIWITVAVPEEAPGGRYESSIDISFAIQGKSFTAQVPVILTVLPVQLAEPPIEYALYYLAWLNDKSPNLDARAKTIPQLRAELQDMRAHGLTNIALDHNYPGDNEFESFKEVLRQMRLAGFKASRLLYVDWKVSHAMNTELYSKKVTLLLNLARTHGFGEAFLYNLDEKDSQTLLRSRASFEVTHQKGAKNFVAFNSGNLEALSGLLDIVVLPRGNIKAVQIAKKVAITPWAYGDPQAGEEKPFTYRDRYGINLWLDGFDGACDYAYQTGSFGWNDWGDPKWRAHNMAYPTLSNPIPTLQWEGFREGIDDTRYLATVIPKERLQGAIGADARRKLFLEVMKGAAPTTSHEIRLKLSNIISSRFLKATDPIDITTPRP